MVIVTYWIKLFNIEPFEALIKVYSQTCVKQPHKGSTKSGCLRQVAANRGEYQYKMNVWEHFVWLLKTGWLLNRGDR